MVKTIKNRDQGFSLLEVVITLSIVSSCVLFFSFAIVQIGSTRAAVKDDRQIEWHLFVNQLAYELAESDEVSAGRERLTLKKVNAKTQREEIVTYERYLRLIRRQVDARGHQPILLEVSSVHFSLNEQVLTIRVVFTNNESYSASLKVNEKGRE